MSRSTRIPVTPVPPAQCGPRSVTGFLPVMTSQPTRPTQTGLYCRWETGSSASRHGCTLVPAIPGASVDRPDGMRPEIGENRPVPDDSRTIVIGRLPGSGPSLIAGQSSGVKRPRPDGNGEKCFRGRRPDPVVQDGVTIRLHAIARLPTRLRPAQYSLESRQQKPVRTSPPRAHHRGCASRQGRWLPPVRADRKRASIATPWRTAW